MSRRSRPHYRPGLEWILGVAFPYTLTRPVRLAQGLPFVRCCGSPRASSPHGLTAPAPASHDGEYCVQLPPARGCYHLAPRRTFTSNPVPMPGTPGRAPPSLRPNPYAAKSPSNPAERHLSKRGNCAEERSQLSCTHWKAPPFTAHTLSGHCRSRWWRSLLGGGIGRPIPSVRCERPCERRRGR